MDVETHHAVRFHDRTDAGRQLAARLGHLVGTSPIVLALPRGGVPVAAPVADALGGELDVLVVRKLGVPWNPEFGMGAIAEGGTVVLDRATVAAARVEPADVQRVVDVERIELARRTRRFRGDHTLPPLAGRTVIVVDDGIATGGTALAAVRDVRAAGAGRIVLAVPVAAVQTLERFRPEVDELVVVSAPDDLQAVGAWYDDFTQVEDATVVRLLEAARRARPDAPADPSGPVRVDADGVVLDGDLVVPPGATGLVVFAHGSGSSRHSARNRAVATVLQRAGFATLLLDLLTAEEERRDAATGALRFDIPLLDRRVRGATAWVRRQRPLAGLPIGLFGASTGAAAALRCAAAVPGDVAAVVSRGGRPDLAADALADVRAPTLLIVGGHDDEVLGLNRAAYDLLPGRKELVVVPGATHLFEEPGALDEVARLATSWFARWLKG